MGKGKRHNPTNPTAKAALDEVEGKVKEHQLSPQAEAMQRRERWLKEQTALRNERIRRSRELAEGDPTGGDAA